MTKLLVGKSNVTGPEEFIHIQWNLAIPATLGTNESGWISEVAGFQGTLLIYKRMNQSFGA